MNNEIRKIIYDRFPTQTACAMQLGWARQKLNKLVVGEKQPNLDEINALSIVLEMPVQELINIFLAS